MIAKCIKSMEPFMTEGDILSITTSTKSISVGREPTESDWSNGWGCGNPRTIKTTTVHFKNETKGSEFSCWHLWRIDPNYIKNITLIQ